MIRRAKDSLPATSRWRGDLVGGATAAIISLPVSMTIGVAAFAPLGSDFVIYGALAGIYGAIIVGLAPFPLGGRSLMISGPRAASALILAALIAQLQAEGLPVSHILALAYIALLVAGALQFAGGVTGFGNIVRHAPHPVIAGFSNCAALVMMSAQIWTVFGIPQGDGIADLLARLGEVQPLVAVPGLAAILAMMVPKRWLHGVPGPLAGLAAGTAVYYALVRIFPDAAHGAVLGTVTRHFPTPEITGAFGAIAALERPGWVLFLVAMTAIGMALLVTFDTLFAQSRLDDLRVSRSDPDKELSWHGLGNMAAAALGGLIGSGGMVRTRPAFLAGGRTHLTGVFASLIMLAAVLMLTRLIGDIPRAVISGMILVLGLNMFDRWSLLLLWQSLRGGGQRRRSEMAGDAVIVLMVMAMGLAVNLVAAVALGTALAAVAFIARMAGSPIRRELRGPEYHSRNYWSPVEREALNGRGRAIAVLELDGVLFFGSADGLDRRIYELQQDGVRNVVLDLKRVRDIDSTGARTLLKIRRRLQNVGGMLVFSYVPREFRQGGGPGLPARGRGGRRLRWSGEMASVLGDCRLFADTDEALGYCEAAVIRETLGDGSGGPAPRALGTILDGMDFREIRQIRTRCRLRRFAAGETLFHQGDTGDGLYYVVRGRAGVYVRLPEREEEKRLHMVLPGGIFGEMALLDDGPRAASVVAIEETFCYHLPAADFRELRDAHPATAVKLLSNISRSFSARLRSANALIAELES